jgi:tetratricopeptide (TPR) repeat protein
MDTPSPAGFSHATARQRHQSATGRTIRWLNQMASLLTLAAGMETTRAAEAAAQEDAIVASIEGRAQFSRRGTAQWQAAANGTRLATGDLFRTMARSRATLKWSELSSLRVDELTTLEVRPPGSKTRTAEVDLKSGASYFFSREKPEEIRFTTPVASGAIRGTEFNLRVGADGRTELALLDGQVDLTNQFGSLALNSGEQGTVNPGQAPRKTAVIDATAIIQWALYYPAVLDPADLGLTDAEAGALRESIAAYRAGDLLGALAAYPEDRAATSVEERVFRAGLLLGAGRVGEVETALKDLDPVPPGARALREMLATVQNRPQSEPQPPSSASEWVARSYRLQSQSDLEAAREAARIATARSPEFGAAWIRLAELEFGFGRRDAASAALERGLALSPRNAQGMALRGFLSAARGRHREAVAAFNQAIELDGALGNAWLGRGLMKIRAGDTAGGRDDLQIAATLEPNRAVLRSYLGKAQHHAGRTDLAEKELALARKLDPNDPTAWLYSALLLQQGNRPIEALQNLQEAGRVNDNRGVYRSQMLLDQDRAVQRANLASIYRDAGLIDVSVREASRAVEDDYANASAHLFLSESYDALRDPKLINLRYETPWLSELLVASLLAPSGGGALSRTISQQEYSRLFEGNHFGLFSDTEYLSRGAWVQSASQFGVIDGTSYSVDAYYRTDPGERANNDYWQLNAGAQFKQQLTEKDSVFFRGWYFESESGDVAQYYYQTNANLTARVRETQEPGLLAGYHREWGPGSHTLALFSRIDDDFRLSAPMAAPIGLAFFTSPFSGAMTNFLANPPAFGVSQRSELVAYSGELQQIWQSGAHSVVVGGRYQNAGADVTSDLAQVFAGFTNVSLPQAVDADIRRYSVYAYDQWAVAPALRLTLGLSYDRLEYPENIDTAPISEAETDRDELLPKAGLIWTLAPETHLRAAFTRSLGGVFFDTSVRLEPTQVGGFNQAYRSLAPESSVGLVPGTRFETISVGLDHAFGPNIFAGVEGQILRSDAVRTVGALTNGDPMALVFDSPSSLRQEVDYQEETLLVTLNQLLSREWAVGARYRLTHAELDQPFVGLGPSVGNQAAFDPHVSALLHQVHLFAVYQHPCGFFAHWGSVWSSQVNYDYAQPLPDESFWQHNLYAGYRFWQRRVQVQVGLLNLTDVDYRLNPLTLYNELPRERTFQASLRLQF